MQISFGKHKDLFIQENCAMCLWKDSCEQHNDDSCVQEYIDWINDKVMFEEGLDEQN